MNKKYHNEYYIKNKSKIKQQVKEYYWSVKQQILFFYSQGTMSCQFCNEDDINNLQIDHLNGNGKQHREMKLRGQHLQSFLLKNNFPNDYLILCKNCNYKKHNLSPNDIPMLEGLIKIWHERGEVNE